MPPIRNGKQRITQNIKRQINRVVHTSSLPKKSIRATSISTEPRARPLNRARIFPLEWDSDSVKTDARLLLEYFENYAALREM